MRHVSLKMSVPVARVLERVSGAFEGSKQRVRGPALCDVYRSHFLRVEMKLYLEKRRELRSKSAIATIIQPSRCRYSVQYVVATVLVYISFNPTLWFRGAADPAVTINRRRALRATKPRFCMRIIRTTLLSAASDTRSPRSTRITNTHSR